jgi:hypothetical protein
MRRIYQVKSNGISVMEIMAGDTATLKDVVEWLREAADKFSGEVKICVNGCGVCFKHQDYECQDCGSKAGLRLVKG